MAKQGLYVEPRAEGDYAVRREDSKRASATAPTQKQAIEKARKLEPDAEIHVARVRKGGDGPDKFRKVLSSTVCNDYEQEIKFAGLQKLLDQLDLQLPAGQGPKDVRTAADIRIGERGPVVRAAGNGVEIAEMTFGFPPPKPKRPRVFNSSRRSATLPTASAAASWHRPSLSSPGRNTQRRNIASLLPGSLSCLSPGYGVKGTTVTALRC